VRFWDTKDANGNPLTDGRVCLVIRSDTDQDMPEIRTYGKDREEVLDKIAKTAETAQEQIHSLRKAPQNTPPARPTTPQVSDVAKAVTELNDPTKAPGAVKTLLKAAGVDVDRQALVDAVKRVANIAEKWEQAHPLYPKDPRNDQILMKVAVNLAGGNLSKVTAEILDQAFEEGTRLELFHEPQGSTVQPGGNPEPRTVREATSYRRNALRSPNEPVTVSPNVKEQKWKEILEKGTGKAVDDAIRAERGGNPEYAGFQEYANKLFAKTA